MDMTRGRPCCEWYRPRAAYTVGLRGPKGKGGMIAAIYPRWGTSMIAADADGWARGAEAREGAVAMWRLLARLANIVWWVWLAATLAVLGYFAVLGLDAIQHGIGLSK